jgi:hypothetical protein
MKALLIVLISFLTVSCASKETSDKKTLDVDRMACAWNKTKAEADKACQPDPNKKTMGERLDTQLNKDAKKIKEFFGIDSGKNSN